MEMLVGVLKGGDGGKMKVDDGDCLVVVMVGLVMERKAGSFLN